MRPKVIHKNLPRDCYLVNYHLSERRKPAHSKCKVLILLIESTLTIYMSSNEIAVKQLRWDSHNWVGYHNL